MRTIERSSTFKRDYKREAKGKHRVTLDADLMPVLAALANDQPLEDRNRVGVLTVGRIFRMSTSALRRVISSAVFGLAALRI